MKKNILAFVGILVFVGIIDFALIRIAENFLAMDLFTRTYVYCQIIGVFSLAVIILWINRSWYKDTNTAASILTMVGVFGTFIGIYIGLQEFNPKELQDSIEVLLNGLKLAFGTSIVGIASALLLKGIISPLLQKFQNGSNGDPRRKTINEFANVLKEVLESVETPGESNLSSKLETLTTTIKEDGETTRDVLRGMRADLTESQSKTLKQLKTLTTTVSDEHNQLREDRKTTRGVLQGTRNNLTDGQGNILGQLETLTKTLSDKHDLIIASQKNEATETRETLTDMQSELTDRQNKAFIQLRTLTKTVSYEHNQLRKEFETFSQNVAESITELATKEFDLLSYDSY